MIAVETGLAIEYMGFTPQPQTAGDDTGVFKTVTDRGRHDIPDFSQMIGEIGTFVIQNIFPKGFTRVCRVLENLFECV